MVCIWLHLCFSIKCMSRSSAESWVGGNVGDLRIAKKVYNSHLGSRLMNLIGKFGCDGIECSLNGIGH